MVSSFFAGADEASDKGAFYDILNLPLGKTLCYVQFNIGSMNIGKVANLERTVLVHCTTLLEHVIIVRTSCLDTDFA